MDSIDRWRMRIVIAVLVVAVGYLLGMAVVGIIAVARGAL